MRIVVDSSVLIAALARPGVCTELLDEVARDHTLALSAYILGEVARKLREKFGLSPSESADLVRGLERQSELVEPVAIPSAACRDPADLPILGTAVGAKAALLITVDKDLLALREYAGIPIVRPGDFWKRLRAG